MILVIPREANINIESFSHLYSLELRKGENIISCKKVFFTIYKECQPSLFIIRKVKVCERKTWLFSGASI